MQYFNIRDTKAFGGNMKCTGCYKYPFCEYCTGFKSKRLMLEEEQKWTVTTTNLKQQSSWVEIQENPKTPLLKKLLQRFKQWLIKCWNRRESNGEKNKYVRPNEM